MTGIIPDVRALLRRFNRMDYRDIWVRHDDFELFIARAGGSANPLRHQAATSDMDAVVSAPQAVAASVIAAPHIGTFLSALPPGSRVEAGAAVAWMDLLGEVIEVPAAIAGIVAAVTPQAGELVEYGAPLVSLVPD